MDENHDYFSVAHMVGFATVLFTLVRGGQDVFLLSCIKKLSEFIGQIENFCNFILGEHSGNRFNVVIGHYKINTLIAILLINRILFYNSYIELTLMRFALIDVVELGVFYWRKFINRLATVRSTPETSAEGAEVKNLAEIPRRYALSGMTPRLIKKPVLPCQYSSTEP